MGNIGDGGTNSLDAAVVAMYLCPADTLPSPAVVQWPGTDVHLGLGSYRLSYSGLDLTDPDWGTDGVICERVVRAVDITDGTSNTLMLGEFANVDPNWPLWLPVLDSGDIPFAAASAWSAPAMAPIGSSFGPINGLLPATVSDDTMVEVYQLKTRVFTYGSRHPGGGANFVMADGSVRFISDAVNNTPALMPKLGTRSRGEVVDASSF